jgi:lipopolysaccharide/colanic/teichoic acid biosynthesis glycosyltransferase
MSAISSSTMPSLPAVFESGADEESSAVTSIRVSSYFRWKSALDRLLALILLIPGLPLIALLIGLIRLTSRGPGVYQQARVGRGGKVYTMLKLRSMRVDAESHTGAVWARQGDPRVTRLGYWLRKLHLDELPQLFNVLRGEMSLIGPRPERPEFVAVLAAEIPGYLSRLEVAPGITGLAQINLPPDKDLDDVRRKLILDREYIQVANLVLDVRVLACTLLRMLGVRGELAMRLLKLNRTVSLPTTQNSYDNASDHDIARQSATPASVNSERHSAAVGAVGSGVHRSHGEQSPSATLAGTKAR